MNEKAFIDLVIEMRFAQRSWYETHEYIFFNRARNLERQVDRILEMYKDSLEKITPTQLNFNFDEQ